jgi:hypothetical protein
MFLADILHVPEPVITQAQPVAAQCGLNTAAAVMAADNDVADLENIDGKLDHGQTIQVRMHHQIGHIPVNKQFAGQKPYDLVRRNPAVRTANPKILRTLLLRQFAKEIRPLLGNSPSPGPVAIEKVFKVWHV